MRFPRFVTALFSILTLVGVTWDRLFRPTEIVGFRANVPTGDPTDETESIQRGADRLDPSRVRCGYADHGACS